MQSKYNKSKHVLVEQPRMERPPDHINDIFGSEERNNWNILWVDYNDHLSTLREIPTQPGTIWEEDKIYEEGKDYWVSAYSDENRIHFIEAIPIPKEDDLPERLKRLMLADPVSFLHANAMKYCTPEQLIVLRDKLIRRTPVESFSREEVVELLRKQRQLCVTHYSEKYACDDDRLLTAPSPLNTH